MCKLVKGLLVASIVTYSTIATGAHDAKDAPSAELPGAPVQRTGLLGLDPSLNTRSDALRTTVQSLWDSKFSEFVDMQASWLKYEPDASSGEFPQMPGHKAGALCLERPNVNTGMTFMYDRIVTHASSFGFSSNYPNVQAAKRIALRSCKAASRQHSDTPCECLVVDLDDKPVPRAPASWYSIEASLKNRIAARKQSRLKSSEVRLTLPDVAKNTTLVNRELSVESDEVLGQYRLSAPTPLKIGYPDSDRDYASACHERYSYALSPLSSGQQSSVRSYLQSIEIGKPYACYYISLNTRENPTETTTHDRELQCRYVDHIDFAPGFEGAPALPYEWSRETLLSGLSDIWVESVVRVNERGFPLEKRPLSRPLAVATRSALYLGVEIVAPKPQGGCNVSYPFQGKVFDVSRCPMATLCASTGLAALTNIVASKLAREPFAANVDTLHATPAEIQFERTSLPSFVLGGAYYERSTYTLQSWAADAEDPPDSLYRRAAYRGVQAENPRYVFIRFQHIYTVSKNKSGPFRDLTPEETREFEMSVNSVLPSSLAVACQELAGELTQGVCVLTGRTQ